MSKQQRSLDNISYVIVSQLIKLSGSAPTQSDFQPKQPRKRVKIFSVHIIVSGYIDKNKTKNKSPDEGMTNSANSRRLDLNAGSAVDC